MNYGEKWNALTNGEKAWMLNQIIAHMNNEEAYYDGWLYIWPDGESFEECLEHFGEDEDYKELEKEFIYRYSNKEYHNDGLYANSRTPNEVIEAAQYWDAKLKLPLICVLK